MAISKEDIAFHVNRQMVLRQERINWDVMWQELSDYLCPGRISTLRNRAPGQKNKTLYDNTGALAAQRLASGLYSRTVNPASKWFFLSPDEEEKDLLSKPNVAQWLDNARNITQSGMNKNASGAFFQVYVDLVTLATSCLFIDEVPLKGARYFTYPIDQIDIAEDYAGQVDTVYRKFKMTIRQISQEFPNTYMNIPDIMRYIEKEPDKKFEIVHCVCPRLDRDPEKYDNLNMPIASYYLLSDLKICLSESGYPEMPYAIPRLEVLTGEKFGRGPGNIALPEVKSLNELQKVRLDNAHLRNRPPLNVPLNAYVNPLQMIPGYKNLNQDEQGRKAEALHVIGDLSFQTADIQESRNIIKEIFYNDQLSLRDSAQMTATEVRERMDLNMQLMGPWQGRLGPEFFDPAVTRSLAINLRQGLIPAPPQELLEMTFDPMRRQWSQSGDTKNLNVVYDSPLARAQRLADVSVIDNTKASLANIAAVDPQRAAATAGMFKLEEMEVDRALSLGLPNKYLKTPEELAAQAQAQQDAAKQQQGMEAMTQGADALNKIKDVPGAANVTQKVMSALSPDGAQ